MSRQIPITVLAWEGPQARAYLVRLRRAGLRPERILVMVQDPITSRMGRPAAITHPLYLRWAANVQDKAHNHHPYEIRKKHPHLVRSIAAAMAGVVDDPEGFYREMYDDFSYESYADEVRLVATNSYKDPRLVDALRPLGPTTVLFTGGGIVPRSVFDLPGIKLIHVHTGYLPHVRGADVLLWSTIVRGRPGVSAFYMTPGLDDGDVLAAKELEPMVVPVPATEHVDDDTLYRALFSFIDPVIRAELLVADVLEPADDVGQLVATPQDLGQGITYHFMHTIVRSRALRMLFEVPRAGAERTGAAGSHPRRYQRFYEKPSALAPARFALDAFRAPTALQATSIQNRQRDYSVASSDERLLALHREMNEQLALQTEQWDSYDYGEGYYYQSSALLKVTGLRNTDERVAAFDLRQLVEGRTVLEIGCNTGFLSLAIADSADRVVAFELNPYLIAIGKAGARYAGVDNVDFLVAAFEDFSTDEQFDDVLSFANHHTYDGNTRQSLEEYFDRCHALTKPGGRLIFESHPPELEGAEFGKTIAIIAERFDIQRSEVHEYGTFLDKGRRFLVAVRR